MGFRVCFSGSAPRSYEGTFSGGGFRVKGLGVSGWLRGFGFRGDDFPESPIPP